MKIADEELTIFVNFAERLADLAAGVIMPYFRSQLDVVNKSADSFDPVTRADVLAERIMRQEIHSQYPKHGILGEEGNDVAGLDPLTWVLDPIDGTRAFITGLPVWGTLIALNDGQRPIIGVMNQPYTGERFTGTPSMTCFNGRRIQARRCASLSSATLMYTVSMERLGESQYEPLRAIIKKARHSRFGGDCYAYCMLASGLVDAVIESHLEPHDVQALIPIVEGAGGIITNWNGTCAQNGGTVVACGDPELHSALVNLLMKKP